MGEVLDMIIAGLFPFNSTLSITPLTLSPFLKKSDGICFSLGRHDVAPSMSCEYRLFFTFLDYIMVLSKTSHFSWARPEEDSFNRQSISSSRDNSDASSTASSRRSLRLSSASLAEHNSYYPPPAPMMMLHHPPTSSPTPYQPVSAPADGLGKAERLLNSRGPSD